MTLLNEPYREFERRQRRERRCRTAAWVCYVLACVFIGIGLGMLLH